MPIKHVVKVKMLLLLPEYLPMSSQCGSQPSVPFQQCSMNDLLLIGKMDV